MNKNVSWTKKGPGRKPNIDISERKYQQDRPGGKLARKIQTKTLTHKS